LTAQQTAIAKAGIKGIANVDLLQGAALPYADHLADLLLVDDLEALKKHGVPETELQRVVAPYGALLVKKGEAWQRTTIPIPEDFAQWTHPFGNAGGLRQVTRGPAFPFGLNWQDGVPISFSQFSAVRSWVVTHGRVFAVSDAEAENSRLMRQHDGKKGPWRNKQYLVARSAASGIPLWKVCLDSIDYEPDLQTLNTFPLVADSERVICAKENTLVAFSAATGEELLRYPVSYPPQRLVQEGGVIVCGSWDNVQRVDLWDEANTKKRRGIWSVKVADSDKGAVEAFDTKTGKLLWKDEVTAQTVLAGNGKVFYMVQTSAPVTDQTLVVRDLISGKELWRMKHSDLGEKPNLVLSGLGNDVVALTRAGGNWSLWNGQCGALMLLSQRDGTKLWEVQAGGDIHVFFVDDQIWYGAGKYSIKDGKVVGNLNGEVLHEKCTPPVLMGRVMGTIRLPHKPAVDTDTNVMLDTGGVRAGCIQGVAVAEEKIFFPQNFCRCEPAHLPGFLTLGSYPTITETQDRASRPVITGKGAPGEEGAVVWPTYRYDNARSASTDFDLPVTLEPSWRTPLQTVGGHRIASIWADSFQPTLTAPVCDKEKVYAALCNEGILVALNVKDGSEAWRAFCPSRIAAPPLLYKGLCITPCNDGWLYAFSNVDGKLVWGTRIAPIERRILAFGMIESPWPVFGTPLLLNETLYAVAGKSSQMNGGTAFVALDPQTGKTLLATKLYAPRGARADILHMEGDALYMQDLSINPKDGSTINADSFIEKKYPWVSGWWRGNYTGYMDGSWVHVGKKRSGGFIFARTSFDTFALGKAGVLGFESPGIGVPTGGTLKYALYQKDDPDIRNTPPAGGWNLKKQEPVLAWSRPETTVITASALSKTKLIVAGNTNSGGGMLSLLNRDDGKPIMQEKLPAAVEYNGICLGENRVFICLTDGSVSCYSGKN
jgi:outer membrane protein assembly factor BamB